MAQYGYAADTEELRLPKTDLFDSLEGISSFSVFNKFDDEWDDSKLASYARIKMFKLMATSPNSRAMCLSALDCFFKNVSPYNVGLVVVLAWNLVSPDGGRQVFEVDELSGTTSKLIDVTTLDAQVQQQCEITPEYVFPQNFDVLLKATAYLAAYPLFVSARDKLNMSSEELIECLKHVMTRDALETIVVILEKHESPQDVETMCARARKTWKYARLFSDAAFARLQTKNCTELVFVLAHLNKLLGTQGAGNVLKIKQIAVMGGEVDAYHAGVASWIYSLRKQ